MNFALNNQGSSPVAVELANEEITPIEVPCEVLVDQLEKLLGILNTLENQQQELINIQPQIKETFKDFDLSLSRIHNKFLKALITHDTKNMILYFKSCLALAVLGQLQDFLQFKSVAVKLVNFVKLLALLGKNSIYLKNSVRDLMKFELGSIVESISKERVNAFWVDFQYIEKVLDTNNTEVEVVLSRKVFVEFEINHQNIFDIRDGILALHTILMNMFRLGASNIFIKIDSMQGFYTIEVYDDIGLGSYQLDEDLNFLKEKINAAPKTVNQTDKLRAEGGLGLSHRAIYPGGIGVGRTDQGGKFFTIFIAETDRDLTGKCDQEFIEMPQSEVEG